MRRVTQSHLNPTQASGRAHAVRIAVRWAERPRRSGRQVAAQPSVKPAHSRMNLQIGRKVRDLFCTQLPASVLGVVLLAGLATGCGGSGGKSTADIATGHILVSVIAQAAQQTQACANTGIKGYPETASPTFLMPPDCATPIRVSDIDVAALGAVRSHPEVDMSTLRIQSLGTGVIKFTLKSPSGRVCVGGIGFAAEPC